MKNKDSIGHDDSSPKHSYHARRPASIAQADGNHPTATPASVQQIGGTEERETFDVPIMQYYY